MKKIIVFLLFLILIATTGFLYRQNQQLSQRIEATRYIYVYNLDDVLIKANLVETKKKFEQEVYKLNDELITAEKKAKSIKDAKVKMDVSEMYMKNLKMKRDELVDKYQQEIEGITKKINDAIFEIAKQRGASTIFIKSAIAVTTPYVIDVSDEVAQRIQK